MAKKSNTVPVITAGEGDKVRLSWMQGDMRVSTEGVIANIERRGIRRSFRTEKGNELITFLLSEAKQITCEMLERYSPQQPGLFPVGEIE